MLLISSLRLPAPAALIPLLSLQALLGLPARAQMMPEGVRVNFSFGGGPETSCEIQLTSDSVRVRRDDILLSAPASMAQTDGGELGRRALTEGERDSAGLFIGLAKRWKGYKRYACKTEDGYGFSLWTDSLLLNCENCFSCSSGIGMGEARMLEKFGRYTLWLYRMKDPWIAAGPGKTGAHSRP